MMDIEDLVKQLKEKYGTGDPDLLAGALDIHIYERDDFTRLLGMSARVGGRSCIFLNAGMESRERRIVLAHELGHTLLHEEEEGLSGIVQFTLFNSNDRTEYEANVFAAHLLLDEGEIQELASDGYDAPDIAKSLNVDINLLLIKLHEMQKKGWKMNLPATPKADFLRRV